jgi:hypothetical protein
MKSEKILILLNHEPDEYQIHDIENKLNIKQIVFPDETIKKIWSSIPSNSEKISIYLEPVKKWILSNSAIKDLVWIQGESGALFNIVSFCLNNKRVPVYSVTERHLEKEEKKNKSTKTTRIFKHVRFRRYENS